MYVLDVYKWGEETPLLTVYSETLPGITDGFDNGDYRLRLRYDPSLR